MTTVRMLQTVFYRNKSLDAVKSTLRRLCPVFLAAEQLDGKQVYYRLTVAGAQAIGLHRSRARRLGRQARLQRFAVLWFMHAVPERKRALLDPRKHPQLFAVQNHRLPRSNFYLEDPPRLGYIVVDHGAHFRGTCQKIARKLQRFLKHGWFDTFFQQRIFTITVLTPFEVTRRTLEQRLPSYLRRMLAGYLARFELSPQQLPLEVQVLTVPGLEAFVMAGSRRKPGGK